jgi:nickel transport protein
MSLAAVLALGIAVLAVSPALAHRLNVFAAWDGTRITGEAYFTGGARAGGIAIRAVAPDGRVPASVRSDKNGDFALPPLAPADLDIVADSGDGHVAHFRITAVEMGASPRPADAATVSSAPAAVPSVEGLESVIDRAVARRLAPVQRQIAEYEAKVRLHDILGGIGYLVGIAGLGFWWLARREAKGKGR